MAELKLWNASKIDLMWCSDFCRAGSASCFPACACGSEGPACVFCQANIPAAARARPPQNTAARTLDLWNIEVVIPFVSATTACGICSGARVAIRTVDKERARETGDASADCGVPATMARAAAGASPRAVSPPRSASRPRARRLLTVPTGQASCCEASSAVMPSRRQRTRMSRSLGESLPSSASTMDRNSSDSC